MQSVIAGLRAVLVMSHLCLRAQMYECGPAVGRGEGGGVEEGKEGDMVGRKGKRKREREGRKKRGRRRKGKEREREREGGEEEGGKERGGAFM